MKQKQLRILKERRIKIKSKGRKQRGKGIKEKKGGRSGGSGDCDQVLIEEVVKFNAKGKQTPEKAGKSWSSLTG